MSLGLGQTGPRPKRYSNPEGRRREFGRRLSSAGRTFRALE